MSTARLLVWSLLCAGASIVVAAVVTVPAGALLGFLNDWASDAQFRARGPLQPLSPIVIVDIGETALGRMGGFPLDRAELAELIDRISAAGPKLIVPDILLTDTRAAQPDADAALHRAIATSGRVLLPFAFTFEASAQRSAGLPAQIEASAFAVVVGSTGDAGGVHPTGTVTPGDAFLDAAGYGHINIVRNGDSTVRLVDAAIRFGDAYFPFLPIVAAARTLGLERSAVVLRLGQAVELGPLAVSIDGDQRILVNDYGASDVFTRIDAVDLLDGGAPADRLRDAIVFVSVSATGVGDLFRNAFSAALPGTDLLATVTDNILSGRTLSRPDWTYPLAIAVAVALALIAAGLVMSGWRVAGSLVAVAGAAGYVAAAQVLFTRDHTVLPLAFPLLAVALSTGLAFAARMRIAGRDRDREVSALRDLAEFAPALSRMAAEFADGDPPKTVIGTVVFADVKGFTRRSEQASPEGAHALMSTATRTIADAAQGHGGTVVKTLGDGAMIVFGMPTPSVEAPAQALGFMRALALGGDAAAPAARAGLDIRLGAHFGPVSIGPIGVGSARGIDIAGDTVNVASRLQALTRRHDVLALASDQLIEAAAAAAGAAATAGFRKLPRTRLRGRERTVGIWALTDEPAEAS